ncbi:MAG TPA: chloride channel protein, partial [Terriglobus sp.]
SQPPNVQMFLPAVAGLIVGCIAYLGVPEVLGVGYGAMDAAMHAQYTIGFLLLLAALKLVSSTLSFSAGAPGGLFATALFLGAMLGSAVGTFEHHFFPSLTGTVGAYALVGMGVFFAAFIRVPLTSVFMIMEISGNYTIVLPVILANTIAYLISRSLQPVPILEEFTHQDGLYLPSLEEEREDTELHFEDALRPPNVPVLSGGETLKELAQTMKKNGEVAAAPAVLIRCSSGWYAARQSEMQGLAKEADAKGNATLEQSLPPRRTPMLFPDQPLAHALPHFKNWPVLPVSNRAMRGVLEGVLTLDDVLARYQK